MKWFRNILKGLSLTGALFVFQACYGTPQPYVQEEATEVEASMEEEAAGEEAPAEGQTQAPAQG